MNQKNVEWQVLVNTPKGYKVLNSYPKYNLASSEFKMLTEGHTDRGYLLRKHTIEIL